MMAIPGQMQNEREWLDAARRGDAWALKQFYDGYQPLIASLCYRLLARPEDVEDALQAIFLRAFRALPNFRGQSSVKTWLYRIAVNECMDLLRKRKSAPEALQETMRIENERIGPADKIAVQQALARLAPDQRVLLALRFWEELSYEEIAQTLGLSLPTVKMRLMRAKQAFRRRYEGTP